MAFASVARVTDLAEGTTLSVEVDGVPVCLVRVADGVKAIHDVCSHEEYALHEGWVYDNSIECALHGSTFDLDTGEPQTLPATVAVPTYAVRIEGDEILVDPAVPANNAPVPDHY